MSRPSAPGRVLVYSEGTSMWPAIGHGDLLKGRPALIGRVEPGSVVVFRQDGGNRIHRLARIVGPEAGSGRLAITAGDRSGPDRPVPSDTPCLLVTAVLRRGRWRSVPGRAAWLPLWLPDGAVRLAARILSLLARRRRPRS
ncbi:S24/S26 family peptidase [Candidatus Fermentibacterales bacterium]|nr:S24/S26 family peptidase [Candidatus Fermentibacterales bacterium]